MISDGNTGAENCRPDAAERIARAVGRASPTVITSSSPSISLHRTPRNAKLGKREELDDVAALVAALRAFGGLEAGLDDELDARVERQLAARPHEPDAPRRLAATWPADRRRRRLPLAEIDEHALARQRMYAAARAAPCRLDFDGDARRVRVPQEQCSRTDDSLTGCVNTARITGVPGLRHVAKPG